MPYSLIEENWIPVLWADGTPDRVGVDSLALAPDPTRGGDPQDTAPVRDPTRGQRPLWNRCVYDINVVNLGEIYYTTLREYGEDYAEKVLSTLSNMPVELVDANRELSLEAARLKARGGLSHADCFAAALAKLRKNAVLATGDKEFRRVADAIKIQWI